MACEEIILEVTMQFCYKIILVSNVLKLRINADVDLIYLDKYPLKIITGNFDICPLNNKGLWGGIYF